MSVKKPAQIGALLKCMSDVLVFSTKYYKVDNLQIYKVGGVYSTYGGDEKYKIIVDKATKKAPVG
jgi:hypothetical protein